MKNKAIFFDRDGTLNFDKGYVFKIKDFIWKKKVFEAIKLLYQNNFKIIIITNQSGIGRSFYKKKDFFILSRWMKKQIKIKGGHVHDVFFAPYYLKSKKYGNKLEKYRRKPNPGMIYEAKKKWNLNLKKSFIIGDSLSDLLLAKKTKINFYKVNHNSNLLNIAKKITKRL